MRRKKSLLIPAVLAFSLCTGAVVPVLAEETSQTADAADNEQETHTQSALPGWRLERMLCPVLFMK